MYERLKLITMHHISERYNLALLPAAVFLLSLPFTHTVALRLLSLSIAVAITLFTWRSRSTPPIPFKLPLVLWAGIAVLSLTWASNPYFSMGEIKNEIVYTMLTFVVFYSMTKGKNEWEFFVRVVKLGFLGISISGILGYWLARDKWDMGGLHGGVGDFSTYLITILPFLLYSAITVPLSKFPKNLVWLLLPILVLGGYLTLNRAFWPALISTSIVFGFLYTIRFHPSQARKRILVGSLVVGLLAFTQFVDVVKQKARQAGSDSEILTKTIEEDPRILIWKFAIENIKQNPLTGFGFGRGAMGQAFKNHFVEKQYLHAHNLLLNYALQMGIGGVLALLILLGAIAREFWQLYRAPDSYTCSIGIVGLSLLSGFIIKNMTDDFFLRQHALLFWAMIGMTLGYGRRHLLAKTRT